MPLEGETIDKQELQHSGWELPEGLTAAGRAALVAKRQWGQSAWRDGHAAGGAALGNRDPQMCRGGSCGGRGVGDPLKGCVVVGRGEARVEKWDQGRRTRTGAAQQRETGGHRPGHGCRGAGGVRLGAESVLRASGLGAGHCPGEMGEVGNPPSLWDPMREGSSFPVKEGRREEGCGGLAREGTSS